MSWVTVDVGNSQSSKSEKLEEGGHGDVRSPQVMDFRGWSRESNVCFGGLCWMDAYLYAVYIPRTRTMLLVTRVASNSDCAFMKARMSSRRSAIHC